MPGQYTAERQLTATILAATFSGVIFYPNDEFNKPSPAGDFSGKYLEVEWEERDDDGFADGADLGGGDRVHGVVHIAIWVEVEAGDPAVSSIAATLGDAFWDGDANGVQFGRARLGASMVDADPARWFGRELRVPYTVHREDA